MSRLHPVFNVVKLSLAPPDPIPGQWMTLLGDALLHPMFPPIIPPIILCHLCTSLLIVASPRWSALATLIAESDGHMT